MAGGSSSSSSTSASKIIAVSLCVTAVLGLWSTIVPRVFGLIPAHTFSVHSYPWNVVSYVFVEPNIILCACSVGFMLTIGGAVEAAVGTSTFMQLTLVTALITSLILLVLSALLYQVGFSWFLQCYCGIWPLAAAVLVPWVAISPTASAAPQLIPTQVQRRHVPTILLAFALIIDLIFRRKQKISDEHIDSETIFPGSVFIPAFLGLCSSWMLQRHFHMNTPIAFHVLLYPIFLRCLSNFTGNGGSQGNEGGNTGFVEGAVTIPVLRSAANVTLLPGSTQEDAERHRSIALAALNSRLQEALPARYDDAKKQHSVV
ncbi:rhomboid-like protein [Trypanosoma theileri]|uniref:Rhomboid-like protein n=1 Tax=Trypanosoma theileri TaxID=67003 RepID=A0A1X0NKP0_9TRYP|nr:rhomboid-like protein [Trypanosoma theileri]ORC85141.1 rhomboid-like protein [Trypanosoma theileri]